MNRAQLAIILGCAFALHLPSSVGAENTDFPYAIEQEKKLDLFKSEPVKFDEIQVLDKDGYDVPARMIRIQEILRVSPDSQFLFLRTQDSVDLLNGLIRNGVDVFLNVRWESYTALVLGTTDKDASSICKRLGRQSCTLPIFVITDRLNEDKLVHESTHIRQYINHEEATALKKLNALANRHGATQEVIFVVRKLYSATLEIPAYTAQYRYLKELSQNSDSNAMIGFADGNALKKVAASKYGAEQMKELTAEGHPFREELWKANILIGEMANRAFVAECCAFIKSEVKGSEIFDVRKLFPNCLQ